MLVKQKITRGGITSLSQSAIAHAYSCSVQLFVCFHRYDRRHRLLLHMPVHVSVTRAFKSIFEVLRYEC